MVWRFGHRAKWELAAAVVAAFMGIATPSFAEDATAPPAQLNSEAGITRLLKLQPPQQTAWRDYLATLPDKSAQAASLTGDQFHAMSLLDRLDFLSDRMEHDLKAVRAETDALHRFYALLTPRQRQIFDVMCRPATNPSAAPPTVSEPAPEIPDYQLPSETRADWMFMPSQADIARVYPSSANKRKLSGRATLTCTADESGYLADCVVSDETPANEGFGNAALEITGYMRMRPATNYGIPVPSEVRLPIRFEPDKAENSDDQNAANPPSPAR